MSYIIKNISTGDIVKELQNYPSKYFGSELVGFDYDTNEIFIIVESTKPVFDSNKEYLTQNKVFTDSLHTDYHQVKICNLNWIINEYSQEIIIGKLNTSLGDHLDVQYPIWERAKHAGEGTYILWDKIETTLTQEQVDRKAYIDSVYAWITQCRTDRDDREAEYINNNIFPSFVWTDRPN